MTESDGIQVAFPPRTLKAHWHTPGTARIWTARGRLLRKRPFIAIYNLDCVSGSNVLYNILLFAQWMLREESNSHILLITLGGIVAPSGKVYHQPDSVPSVLVLPCRF